MKSILSILLLVVFMNAHAQNTCLDAANSIPTTESSVVKNQLLEFLTSVTCDESTEKVVSDCLENLTKYEKYFKWDTESNTCKVKKMSITMFGSDKLDEETANACYNLSLELAEESTSEGRTTMNFYQLYRMQEAGCLAINIQE